jgi:hypothetical protein
MQIGSFRTFMVGVLSFAVLGCGGSAGFLRDSITQVQVQKGGFMVVKTGLTSSASTGSVFCVIPVDDGQVYRKAMEGLHGSARLGPNQMLINIREDISNIAYLGFFCTRTHTLSADVIEFAGDGSAMPQPQPMPPQPNYPVPPR